MCHVGVVQSDTHTLIGGLAEGGVSSSSSSLVDKEFIATFLLELPTILMGLLINTDENCRIILNLGHSF